MRLLLLLTALFLPLPLAAETVDQIVAKALVARGGVERIKAIKTQRLRGRIAFGSEVARPFAVEMKRPGKMREEVTLKGGPFRRATLGDKGWQLDQTSGKGEVAPLAADELHNMAGGADLDGPLLDYQAKGTRIELAGTEKVGGKDAFKLKLTLKDGEVRYDFIDCTSFVEVKWRGTLHFGGKAVEMESIFSDHRKVAGLLYPFAIESGAQHLVFDTVEVDPPLDDSRFEKP